MPGAEPPNPPPAARLGDARGQAAVEFVALLPLVVGIIAVAYQALLAGQAVWEARVAPRAAARGNAFGAAAPAAPPAPLRPGPGAGPPGPPRAGGAGGGAAPRPPPP